MPVERNIQRPSLALTATVAGRDTASSKERLIDPEALGRWLASAGLRRPDARPLTDPDLRRVRKLREAIHRLALATATATPAAALDIQTVNSEVTRPLRLALTSDGRITRDARAAEDIEQVTSVLAHDAIDLLTGPHAAHLHVCAADGCATVYLDVAGRRTWCSTRCGTRARVNAHRTRHRPTAPGA